MIHDKCVVIVENNDVASALRAFKKEVEAAGVMRELRRRACHMKPSAARIAKSRTARAKTRRAEKRQEAWRTKQSG